MPLLGERKGCSGLVLPVAEGWVSLILGSTLVYLFCFLPIPHFPTHPLWEIKWYSDLHLPILLLISTGLELRWGKMGVTYWPTYKTKRNKQTKGIYLFLDTRYNYAFFYDIYIHINKVWIYVSHCGHILSTLFTKHKICSKKYIFAGIYACVCVYFIEVHIYYILYTHILIEKGCYELYVCMHFSLCK